MSRCKVCQNISYPVEVKCKITYFKKISVFVVLCNTLTITIVMPITSFKRPLGQSTEMNKI